MSHRATINLITHDPKRDAYVLVMVEHGDRADYSLDRLQQRLYDFVDIAVSGLLAEKYPESRGKSVVIRLDCYDTPKDECESLLFRFAEHVYKSESVRAAIAEEGHVKDLDFEFNWQHLP